MALFTGAFFVAQVSLIIVAKPFYAIFCTSCVPHKPKAGFTACQMVDNLYKPQNKMFHFCKTFCSKITLVNTIQNVILNPI